MEDCAYLYKTWKDLEDNILSGCQYKVIEFYGKMMNIYFPNIINIFRQKHRYNTKSLGIHDKDFIAINQTSQDEYDDLIQEVENMQFWMEYISSALENPDIEYINLPCSIVYTNTSHATLILIDKIRKKIIYFDSHGYKGDGNEYFQGIITQLISVIFEKYQQSYTGHINEQKVQNSLGICVYYCILFQYLYVKYGNNDCPSCTIMQIMTDGNELLEEFRNMTSLLNGSYYHIPDNLNNKKIAFNPPKPRFDGSLNLNLFTDLEQINALIYHQKPFILINQKYFKKNLNLWDKTLFKSYNIQPNKKNGLVLVYHTKYDYIVQILLADGKYGLYEDKTLLDPIVLGMLIGYTGYEIHQIHDINIKHEIYLRFEDKLLETEEKSMHHKPRITDIHKQSNIVITCPFQTIQEIEKLHDEIHENSSNVRCYVGIDIREKSNWLYEMFTPIIDYKNMEYPVIRNMIETIGFDLQSCIESIYH
jgi:hypothetical protein